MLDCFKNMIGVTTSECQCIITGLTTAQREELADSKSGLYLDNLEGGIHMKVLKNVDACKSMYDMTTTARDEAIQMLEDDLVVALSTHYKQDKKGFAGHIGRPMYAQNLNVAGGQGIKISPVAFMDAFITIDQIQIIVNQTANINLKLYKRLGGNGFLEEMESWDISAIGNAYTSATLSEPLKLPIREGENIIEYYFHYVPPTGVFPKDTVNANTSCSSCGGRPAYEQYVKVQGVKMADINNPFSISTDSFSHGLIISTSIQCDEGLLFCREYADNKAVKNVMNYAARYKAGELLIEDVLKQPDINRYTTMDKERLWGKRNHFRKEYETRILWLANKIDVSSSNCYVCDQKQNQPTYTEILS